MNSGRALYAARDPADDPDVSLRRDNRITAICTICGEMCSKGGITGLCVKCNGRRGANIQARRNRERQAEIRAIRQPLYHAALDRGHSIPIVAEAARDKHWKERLILLSQTPPNGRMATNPEGEVDLSIPRMDDIVDAEAADAASDIDLVFLI